MANEKARYSDEELEEFRAIIEEKLKVAKQTYRECMAQLNHSDSNDVLNTKPPRHSWIRFRAQSPIWRRSFVKTQAI